MMYLKILFVLLILFGVARAGNSDSGLRHLRQHSANSFASRHTVIAKPPSSIVKNSHLLGGHLDVRGDGCPSGYNPCGDGTCCPPGCLPCNDNTHTCCEIGQCLMPLLCSPTHIYYQVHSVQPITVSLCAGVLETSVQVGAKTRPLLLRQLTTRPPNPLLGLRSRAHWLPLTRPLRVLLGLILLPHLILSAFQR